MSRSIAQGLSSKYDKASPLAERLFCGIPHIWMGILAIALFQATLMPNVDTYNFQRYVQFFIFGISLVLSVYFFFKAKFALTIFPFSIEANKRTFLFAFFAILIGALGSVVKARLPIWAILDLEYWLLIATMICVLSTSFRLLSLKSWQYFGVTILVVIFLYAVRSLLEILILFPFSSRLTVTPGFANIRLYSDVAVVLLPLSWLALVKNPTLKVKVAVWLCNVFLVWILMLTEARSGLLSLGMAVVFGVFRYIKYRRLILGVSLSVFVSSLFIYFVVPVLSNGSWVRDVTSSNGRWELWGLSSSYFFDSFPFGIGGMMFAADGRLGVASPHNLIFTLMAEWGALFLAGLVVILLALGKKIAPVVEPKDEWCQIVRIPVTLATIAGGVNLLFAGAQIAPFSSLCLILACGAYISLQFRGDGANRQQARNGRLLLIGMLGIFAHASYLGYELHEISEQSRPVCVELANGVLFPRFWVQGRLDCGIGILGS